MSLNRFSKDHSGLLLVHTSPDCTSHTIGTSANLGGNEAVRIIAICVASGGIPPATTIAQVSGADTKFLFQLFDDRLGVFHAILFCQGNGTLLESHPHGRNGMISANKYRWNLGCPLH